MLASNHAVVLTDVKMDDILAMTVLYMWAAKHHVENISIVITNVIDIEGARGTAALFLQSVGRSPNVKFYKGALPEAQVGLDGNPVYEAKSHEFMFPKLLDSVQLLPAWSKTEPQPEPGSDRFAPGSYSVFALAPCQPFYTLMERAAEVFIGLGYNSGGITIEQLQRFPRLKAMNNMSPYVYSSINPLTGKTEEGGRFSSTDNDIWPVLEKITSKFNDLKAYALQDSVKFMGRQVEKQNKALRGADCTFQDGTPITQQNIIDRIYRQSKEVVQLAKTLHDMPEKNKSGPSHKAYLKRIIEQLEKNEIQIECTDGQHMVLWLSQLHQQSAKLQMHETFGYIVFSDKQTDKTWATALAPKGITLEQMRETFIQFISGL